MLAKLIKNLIHGTAALALLALAAGCSPATPVASSGQPAQAAAPGGAVVRVAVPDTALKPGDTLRVPVQVENIANLTALEVHLSFDAALLEVAQVENGGFVAADIVAQNVFDNNAGTLDYAVAQMGKPAVNGSGALLVVVFRARAAGQARVGFRGTPAAQAGVLLAGADGAALQVTLQDGVVNISQ